MKALAFSPAAVADLDEIWDYSAELWGIDQADRYSDDIRDTCSSLASGTIRGRIVDVRGGYLRYSIGSHVIYFREKANRIEIIRILHQRQDTSRNLPG